MMNLFYHIYENVNQGFKKRLIKYLKKKERKKIKSKAKEKTSKAKEKQRKMVENKTENPRKKWRGNCAEPGLFRLKYTRTTTQ